MEVKTKVVKQCGKEFTLYLRNCRMCDEATWFTETAFVCDECVSEYIDLKTGERSSSRLSDRQYQGCVQDKTEALGLPDDDFVEERDVGRGPNGMKHGGE